MAHRDRRRARDAGSGSSRSGRRDAGSAPPTPTRRPASGSASRICSTRRSCAQKIELALAEKNVWLERVYEHRAVRARGRRVARTRRTRSGCGRTSPTPRCSSTRRSGAGKRVLLRRRARGRCSTSTTARIRSSRRRTRSPARRGRELRDRAEPDRRGARRREGVRDPRRRGAVPERDRGEPRRRSVRELGAGVRHGHRPRAALRLARPRRAPLRRAAERDHVARADEARRALRPSTRSRSASATGFPTAPRPTTSRRTRATSTTARAGVRDAARLGRAARRLPTSDACPLPLAGYVEFVVEPRSRRPDAARRHGRRAARPSTRAVLGEAVLEPP